METIYGYIKEQESSYQKPITIDDGWNWSMKEHLRRSFLYKNSQFTDSNEDRYLRPNKNIVLAIMNVQYRTEGFDVKDIELYVNSKDEYYKSFLVKKYHDKWAPENFIDTFIDDLVVSYCDYGGVLVRNTNESRPEVIDLKSLAFCNQTSILDYPFAITHNLSPNELRTFGEDNGWGEDSKGATIDIESLLVLCKEEKFIKVYEVHGTLPQEWLKGGDMGGESKKDVNQINIVAYYKKQDGNEQGVTLFRSKEPKLPFKFLARDKIYGRALGRGGIEELFENQVWTNWNEIKITEMLESASKMIPWTTDPTLAAKHPSGMKNMENMEFLEIANGSQIGVVDNYPRNLAVFNDAVMRWQDHAQQVGSASDAVMGEAPSSGTPFKLYEAQQIESKSMHRYRQGQIATFMDEIYRDWILPHIASDITKGHEFLAELSSDEMAEVSEQIAENTANRKRNEQVLNGELPDDKETIRQEVLTGITKSNKKFIEILKDEIKKDTLSVMTNIAGKQKNLALLTDKLVGVLRQYIATPQIRQDPEMTKILNVILESSGLSPIMFGGQAQLQAPMQQGAPQTGGMQQLAQANQKL